MTAWQRDPLAELEEEETRPRGFARAVVEAGERESFVRLRPYATLLGDSGIEVEAPATTWPMFPIGSSEPYGTARVTAALRRRWVAFGAQIERFVARLVAVERAGAATVGGVDALRARAHDFGELRESLYEVQLDVGEPTVERLFGEHGSVSPFLTGLYIWCEDSLEALESVGLTSDAWVLHARLDQASHYYFDGLVPRIRAEVDALRGMRTFGAEYDPVELFGEHLEELFFAASFLHERLVKGLAR